MFAKLRSEGKQILEEVIDLAYFMRGAVQYNDLLMTMSFGERDLMKGFLKRRIENESKSPHPNY